MGSIVLDVPAEDPTFRFGLVAKLLAGVIQASEPRFAVGIFGGWGSGKSTLMNEIDLLVSAQQHQAVVVRFNAWRYEREPHLMVPLLDTIRASLATSAATQVRDAPSAPPSATSPGGSAGSSGRWPGHLARHRASRGRCRSPWTPARRSTN